MLTWTYAIAHYTLMWPMLGMLTWAATYVGLVTASFLWLLIECIGFKPIPRNICRDCGYRLLPDQQRRCPECGCEMQGESSGDRPRRRSRRRILLALIVFVSSVAGPIVYAPGRVLPYVPFSVLVRFAPLESIRSMSQSSATSMLDQEVLRRARSPDFSLENNMLFVREQLKRRDERGRLVHHRHAWPEGETMVMRFCDPIDDLATTHSMWIHVHAGLDGTQLASFICLNWGNMARVSRVMNVRWEEPSIEIPDRFIQDGHIELQIYGQYVDEGDSQNSDSNAPVLLHHVSMPARRVNAVDDIIQPVRGEDIDNALRSALRIDCRHGTRMHIQVALWHSAPLARYADVAFGLNCEVVQNGAIIYRSNLLLDVENDRDGTNMAYQDAHKLMFSRSSSGRGGRKIGAYGLNIAVDPLEADTDANSSVAEHDLTLKLIGNGRLGLSQLEKRRYWDGVLEIPLRCE